MPSSFEFDERSLFNFEKATMVVSGGKLFVHTDEERLEVELDGESEYIVEMRTFLSAALDGVEHPDADPRSVRESVRLARWEIDEAVHAAK